jgi:hypothetical protein
MEKEGFVRSIAYLNENGLEIGELVTDRHVQLVNYIRKGGILTAISILKFVNSRVEI